MHRRVLVHLFLANMCAGLQIGGLPLKKQSWQTIKWPSKRRIKIHYKLIHQLPRPIACRRLVHRALYNGNTHSAWTHSPRLMWRFDRTLILLDSSRCRGSWPFMQTHCACSGKWNNTMARRVSLSGDTLFCLITIYIYWVSPLFAHYVTSAARSDLPVSSWVSLWTGKCNREEVEDAGTAPRKQKLEHSSEWSSQACRSALWWLLEIIRTSSVVFSAL